MHCRATGDVWIGLQRRLGNWTWVDGSAVTNDHWASGHPKRDEDCAIAKRDKEFMEWKSEDCSVEHRVACFNVGRPESLISSLIDNQLKTETVIFQEDVVSTMVADASPLCVAISSATMILPMRDSRYFIQNTCTILMWRKDIQLDYNSMSPMIRFSTNEVT